ncbi:MAG: response regulator, partial [Planctomycetes bacterium]|nr:response regulator [Planctomycetota bacterium]
MFGTFDGAPPAVYLEFLTAQSLCAIVAGLLLVWVSWQSYRQHGAAFLKLWAGSWLAYLAARGLTILQLGQLGERSLGDWLGGSFWTGLSLLAQIAYYLHLWLLVVCLRAFAGRREQVLERRRLYAGAVVVTAFAALSIVATAGAEPAVRLGLRVALSWALTAAAFAVCGVALVWHGRRIDRIGAQLAGASLVFGAGSQGLQAVSFGLGDVYGLAPYFGAFEVLVICALGLGLVLWMQENLTAETRRVNQALGESTQALLQAQRLESVGQLAGGIAHDFNNVLTVVIGNTETTMSEGGLAPPVRQRLAETRSAALQAAKLTSQLLSLARNPASAARPVDVPAEVREILPLLQSLAGARVRITIELPPVPLRAMLKRGHVEQVLLNLVTNARDAIPGEGAIRLRVAREFRGGRARVVVSATDTGIGMSDAVRRRVGELFFTTKGGRGNGMGMASVRSILTETRGDLAIDTDEGRGATVTVTWPEVEVGERPAEPTFVLPERPPERTILLAEDDPMVRRITRQTLEAQGFRVLVEENSRRAAEVVREHAGPIDLLLSDIEMPELSGPGLARLARAARPGIAVRFISGYVDERTADLAVATPVLGKPFTRDELLAFVREALAEQAGT